jgi:nucleotide-binding universal stress UspA family protein
MKNILVAIDFGEASKRALDQARTLAAGFEGSLHLLCVVQNPFSFPWRRPRRTKNSRYCSDRCSTTPAHIWNNC